MTYNALNLKERGYSYYPYNKQKGLKIDYLVSSQKNYSKNTSDEIAVTFFSFYHTYLLFLTNLFENRKIIFKKGYYQFGNSTYIGM